MIDRLIEKIKENNNPSVVGLDPTLEMIPKHIKEEMYEIYGKTPKAVASMFYAFNKAIIDEIHDIIPAVKPQIAMYEMYGIDGIRAYLETTSYAREKGLIVIGDIKRGDISSTAECYAAHTAGTHIEGNEYDIWMEDCVTLNPYMGYDTIEPFLEACREKDKGLFILVKTSNKSGVEIQDLISDGRPIYEHIAELVSRWGESFVGKCGYSKIGAVVGATYKEQGIALRKIMPKTFFLVPGYGAQGGKAEDLVEYFDKNGLGCIINSSRGIIGAYKNNKDFAETEFAKASRQVTLDMAKDLQRIL